MGINPKELYHIDFKKFKSENPKIFALPSEVQKMRFEHFNKTKNNLIEEVKSVIKSLKKNKKIKNIKNFRKGIK